MTSEASLNQTPPVAKLQRCWSEIGITGDRTCPELPQMIHCRNCPVYATAGRSLLNQESTADYRTTWTDLLAIAPTPQTTETVSVVIFRLGNEWFAIPAALFAEVTPLVPVHTLPHRGNAILKGLVNIHGEICLCVSLASLLHIEAAPHPSGKTATPTGQIIYQRMVVVQQNRETWVFPVDEVYGLHRLHPTDLKAPPANVTKAKESYTIGRLEWGDRPPNSLRQRHISYLDAELLFSVLSRRAL